MEQDSQTARDLDSEVQTEQSDPPSTDALPDGQYVEGPKEVLDEDSVFKQVLPTAEDQDALLGRGPEGPLERHWLEMNRKLKATAGLRFGLAYTTVAQWAPDSPNGTQGIGGDLDFTGVWRVFGSEEERNGLGSRVLCILAHDTDLQ
jgi:hypothetical protein